MDGMTTSINSILKNLIKNFNTLLDCPVRFSGEYDKQKVQNFIEYIEYYKRIKCIADEQALQELQHLLLDEAQSWWLRRKAHLTTWSEALTVLENQYSKRRPAHVVYTEIIKHHYEDYESKDDFIDDKIELFSELSQPGLRDENKLEIIYALLPTDIQNKVKIVNVNSIKDLKEQLKILKLDSVTKPCDNENITSTSSTTTTITATNNNQAEMQNINSNNTTISPMPNNLNSISVPSFTSAAANEDERDPIIKVRPTQDLMPPDIKEEQENTPQIEEVINSNSDTTHANNIIQTTTSHDDFQIDSDIMNQINNIIDESEMNIRSLSNPDNRAFITESKNGVTSLDMLGFIIDSKPTEVTPTESPDPQNKYSLKGTKKNKIRCSYCRHFNHTAQVCFKRAKHMKLFPERFPTNKTKESQINENTSEFVSLNNSNSTIVISNNTNAISSTESFVTPFSSSNSIPGISVPVTTLSNISPIVTSSPTVILNNISEKCNNSSLTTKLIAPINGKMPNKILAAKLRITNTPSPKCHQCGTVGFYKSICPNCSPIYNNNNHNQYNK
ncbi:uncharacterized protein ACRADG_006643 [Cochliomyia hominivorax]